MTLNQPQNGNKVVGIKYAGEWFDPHSDEDRAIFLAIVGWKNDQEKRET